jgi:endonuclease-3
MTRKQLYQAMTLLRQQVPNWDVPVVSLMAQEERDPYRVLISTLLSLRTQDQTTALAAKRLFALADTSSRLLSYQSAADSGDFPALAR